VQDHTTFWKLERIGATVEGVQMLEYRCNGEPRSSSATSRNRCPARLVAVEVAPDEWDVLTRHTDEKHTHRLACRPVHPFLLTDAVKSADQGMRTCGIWAAAVTKKESCEKLLQMPPLPKEEEVKYMNDHRIPCQDQALYKACRERSVTPYGGKQEFKGNIKSPTDRNAAVERVFPVTAKEDVRQLNTTCARLHDAPKLLALATPLVAFLRVPLVLGCVSTSLGDGDIRRVRHVVKRKELDGKLVETKLKEELRKAAELEPFIHFIDAVKGDCDWHAFIMSEEQRAWLNTDPRLGRTVQADYTFHVFGKKQNVKLGALVDVHPVSGRALPLAFFVYKDSGEMIRRRTLEWALRELQAVMEDHAVPGRSIEHIVVDWENAHLAAGLDYIMKHMDDALSFLDGELGRLCSGVESESESDNSSEEDDDDSSHAVPGCVSQRTPASRRSAARPIRGCAAPQDRRRNNTAAAKQWLDKCEESSRFAVVETTARWAKEGNFARLNDVDKFAQMFDIEPQRVACPDRGILVQDLLVLARRDFQCLAGMMGRAALNAPSGGSQRRVAGMVPYVQSSRIYGGWLRACNRHRHVLGFLQMPHVPLLHGCIVHFKRSVRHKAMSGSELRKSIMRLLGDALLLPSPRRMAQSLGHFFFLLRGPGSSQLRNYLTRTWLTKSWKHFLWPAVDAKLYTTNAVECIWAMLKRRLLESQLAHQIVAHILPFRGDGGGSCQGTDLVSRCGREGLQTPVRRSPSRAGIDLASVLRSAAQDGTIGAYVRLDEQAFFVAATTAPGSHDEDQRSDQGDHEGGELGWYKVEIEEQVKCQCRTFLRSVVRAGEHAVQTCRHVEALHQLRSNPHVWVDVLASLDPSQRLAPGTGQDCGDSLGDESDTPAENSSVGAPGTDQDCGDSLGDESDTPAENSSVGACELYPITSDALEMALQRADPSLSESASMTPAASAVGRENISTGGEHVRGTDSPVHDPRLPARQTTSSSRDTRAARRQAYRAPRPAARTRSAVRRSIPSVPPLREHDDEEMSLSHTTLVGPPLNQLQGSVPEDLYQPLPNSGTDCFVIAVVQCLRHSPLFVAALRQYQSDASAIPVGVNDDDDVLRIRALLMLVTSMPRRPLEDDIWVTRVRELRGTFPSEIHSGQHDAGYVLQLLLDALNCPATAIPTTTKRTCLVDPEHWSYTFTTDTFLTVCIDDVLDWKSVFASYSSGTDGEVSFCLPCGPGCQTGKSFSREIAPMPPVLCIRLQRFRFVRDDSLPREIGGWRSKNTNPIDMPLMVNFPDHPEHTWSLRSAVVHHGETLDSGHYTTIVRSGCGEDWYEFDDAKTPRKRSKAHVHSKLRDNGYLFLYERRSRVENVQPTLAARSVLRRQPRTRTRPRRVATVRESIASTTPSEPRRKRQRRV